MHSQWVGPKSDNSCIASKYHNMRMIKYFFAQSYDQDALGYESEHPA